ncbi:hypothetical protein Tco_0298304 [Tanacetum coccineum]
MGEEGRCKGRGEVEGPRKRRETESVADKTSARAERVAVVGQRKAGRVRRVWRHRADPPRGEFKHSGTPARTRGCSDLPASKTGLRSGGEKAHWREVRLKGMGPVPSALSILERARLVRERCTGEFRLGVTRLAGTLLKAEVPRVWPSRQLLGAEKTSGVTAMGVVRVTP